MDPFGELGVDLSPSELRETAYEILVGACRSSSSGRPLKYNSNSNSKANLERSLTTSSSLGRAGSEMMRVQMRVSEKTDSRIRRGLLRVAAGQLGKRIESIVLPLELLQQLRSSDFTSQEEYDAWKKRILKILEAGLLVHPHLPPQDKSSQKLRQILREATEEPIDTSKHSESMQILRNVVTSLACTSQTCHWADGIPLNFHLYKILLEACFDVNDETSLVEDVDVVLEHIKKTWVILGINQIFHNLCYLWVLFHRYITSDQTQDDLLFASDRMMVEVKKDANARDDPKYFKILSSTLGLILDWAEKMLLRYHDVFYRSNIDVMQSVLSIGVSAASIMEDVSYVKKKNEVGVACGRVDAYIRSSLRNAFSQKKEKIISINKSSKTQRSPLPVLSILAQDICDLAFNEKEIYSPVLKKWHPLATGVAVATLHACYANELKKFVSNISELNPEAIQVLLSADKLEKDLVEMAVADSVNSEDGGKAIIQEMAPYEAEAVIATLVKSWIQTRIDRFGEWVDRNLQQEDWNPQVNGGRFAPSGVEVLRIIDETLEAFFLLPIPLHPVLLPELMGGLDKCLQNYIIKAKSGCGSRVTFVPTLPALTRCTTGSKFSAFKRKDRSLMGAGKKSQVYTRNGDDSYSVPRLCLRINTLYHIRKELEVLKKRTISNLMNCGFVHDENFPEGKFGISLASCVEGIQQLSEAAAYKLVFHDLSHVLWDYLYMAETSRIEPFLEELEQNLELISVTVHDKVRTRVITEVMKASFEGFLLVLLAGGPSRGFTLQDAAIIEEDFKFLKDLFWSNGDGLPVDLIDKFSVTIRSVLPLFRCDTEDLIERLNRATLDMYGTSAKSKLTLPPTTGQWSPNEPNTILRVLCNRNDKIASKFLKKNYDLPQKT
ncbi:hypothetical protein ACJIZ3_021217 [Penstemon smallii]|uniref:Uncharacterized protein n=1 Tax=Penstemon smallii TaxID=265156 RepID=A0ABD3SL04_9LAMI